MPPVSRIPAEALVGALQSGRYPWWFPVQLRDLAYDYFVYGTDFTPLAANDTATNGININSDSHFMVLSGVMVETDTANTTFLGNRPMLVTIQEASSGRLLSNQAIHADNWFGTAELPKYWDSPKLFVPNSTVNITVQNLDTANAYNVRLALHGFKIYGFRQ